MKRYLWWVAVSMVLIACACAAPEPAPSAADAVAVPPPPAEELPPPFTSEQIRDEWAAGLRLTIERSDGDGAPVVERWTVTESDNERATIEFVTLDASGNPVGEPALAPSGWDDLRDHARFAPGSATRERVTRQSELGTLDGWSYTVAEDDGVVSEYFFADRFPGVPVDLVSRRGDDVVATLRQLKRDRIDLP